MIVARWAGPFECGRGGVVLATGAVVLQSGFRKVVEPDGAVESMLVGVILSKSEGRGKCGRGAKERERRERGEMMMKEGSGRILVLEKI